MSIDDQIRLMRFYVNLETIADTVTLEEAEAAVSSISGTDIEYEEQIEEYDASE